MNEVKKNFSKWMYYFLLALAIIIVYKFLDNFTAIGQAIGKFFDVIAPFLTGGLLAYLLYIPASRIEKGFEKSKRKLIKKKARHKCFNNIYYSNFNNYIVSKCNITCCNR